MVDLILRPSSLTSDPRVRWALQLRYHGSCGKTENVALCLMSDATAEEEIARAGGAYWHFDDPTTRADWKTELGRLEPEEMSRDEMRLEIVGLRRLVAARSDLAANSDLGAM